MIPTEEKKYQLFWAEMFGVTIEEIQNRNFTVSSSGRYVLKNPDTVFFFEDLETGKRIMSAPEDLLAAILARHSLKDLQALRAETIKTFEEFSEQPAFDDVDFYLPKASDLRGVADTRFDIRPISEDSEALKIFYSDCSEDDIDTLDLAFEDDYALGVYDSSQLLAVARYIPIRDSGFADITVVVAYSHRGKKLATPLVRALVEAILAAGLIPKYRVGKENLPSIAVARKLGFKEKIRLMTWEKKKKA